MPSRTVDPVSSQPNVPATPHEPRRKSYDALFGDAPDEPWRPVAAPEEPQSYDDPPDGAEPYLPPGARVAADEEAPVPAAPSWDGDPAAAARAGKLVDTGRLYHSAGAAGPATADALPALPKRIAADHAGASSSLADPAGAALASAAAVLPAAEPAAGPPAPAEAAPVPTGSPRFEGVAPERADAAAPAPAQRPAGDPALANRGLTYLGVVTVVGVPTLLVGLAQALISNRIGWLTGLVLLATSCYAALTVRRPDFSAAIVVPPLAFLVTTLVAGQFALGDGSSLVVRETFVIVRTLAENAPWVLGATAIAAVIVLVRRRRA